MPSAPPRSQHGDASLQHRAGKPSPLHSAPCVAGPQGASCPTGGRHTPSAWRISCRRARSTGRLRLATPRAHASRAQVWLRTLRDLPANRGSRIRPSIPITRRRHAPHLSPIRLVAAHGWFAPAPCCVALWPVCRDSYYDSTISGLCVCPRCGWTLEDPARKEPGS